MPTWSAGKGADAGRSSRHHAWVWSFLDDPRLSAAARAAALQADAVFVSPISFFEIGQKVRIGRWPEMADHVSGLADFLRDQGGLVASLSPEICLRASLMDWTHRDPFDRVLAATAQIAAMALISADDVFDGLPTVHRIW